MKRVAILLLLVGLSGCARDHVMELGRRQGEFYDRLERACVENRDLLRESLRQQLVVDRMREHDLLAWDRDLAKAEVLLQVSQEAAGNGYLLLLKAAELDLRSTNRWVALQSIDDERLGALLALYDAVIEAVRALDKNGAGITSYLAGDRAFTLASLDVAGLVRAASLLQTTGGRLGYLEQRSADERAKADEEMRDNVERVRDVLVEALKKME